MTGPPAIDVSVVIPAYREGARLSATVEAVTLACRALGTSFEVIVVVDGPEEATLQAVDDMRGSGVTVLVNARNRGKGYSVRRGVLQATGRVVLFTDADLSIPMAHAGPFIDAVMRGADIAIASRLRAEATESGPRAAGRRSMTRAFNWLVRRSGLPDISDSQCGFKAFRGEVARDLFERQRIDGFAFDVEVLLLARRLGYGIVELPVTCVYYSQSSVRRVFDSLAMVTDLARIAWRHRGRTGS